MRRRVVRRGARDSDGMTRPIPRVAAPIAALALIAAACSSDGSSTEVGGGTGASGSSAGSNLAAQVASSDLYVGAPQDFQVGVFASDDEGAKLLSYGAVDLTFSFLGAAGSATAEPGVPAGTFAAGFVAAPGTGGAGAETPTLTAPSDARGVYVNEEVAFDDPGLYEATVAADIDGLGQRSLTATFQVFASPRLPALGQRAPKTTNHVLGEPRVTPVSLDSRAQDGEPIPDPELHRTTIAEAIAAGRPALVLFATPVYCISQFCGPTTDALQAIAADHPGPTAFIHVEIWKDYDESVVNEAAADWLLRDGDITEPWLFLIGADGRIAQR